jgi:hypothetical protein
MKGVPQMTFTVRSGAIVLFTSLILGSTGASSQVAQPSGVDVVWAYAGTWTVETDSVATSYSKPGHEKKTLRNACWKNGVYLACNQYVDGDSKVLIVFTYNKKDNIYTSYQIPRDGSQPGSGKMIAEGNVWTFPWQVTDGDKTTWFHVVNTFVAPDKIEYRQEFSTDKIHWTIMSKGVEVRTGTN